MELILLILETSPSSYDTSMFVACVWFCGLALDLQQRVMAWRLEVDPWSWTHSSGMGATSQHPRSPCPSVAPASVGCWKCLEYLRYLLFYREIAFAVIFIPFLSRKHNLEGKGPLSLSKDKQPLTYFIYIFLYYKFVFLEKRTQRTEEMAQWIKDLGSSLSPAPM